MVVKTEKLVCIYEGKEISITRMMKSELVEVATFIKSCPAGFKVRGKDYKDFLLYQKDLEDDAPYAFVIRDQDGEIFGLSFNFRDPIYGLGFMRNYWDFSKAGVKRADFFVSFLLGYLFDISRVQGLYDIYVESKYECEIQALLNNYGFKSVGCSISGNKFPTFYCESFFDAGHCPSMFRK